ncbi:hypothetical protein JCM8097_008963 [Rhodosporidiobolus ruineniae]
MGNVFSVPIFIITLRETIEAAIIVSVLLGLVESLVADDERKDRKDDAVEQLEPAEKKRIVRRMRFMIWAGALLGLFVALCIGAAFIAVFFTTLSDLWSKSEQIWEGVFSLIAAIIIYIMGLTMLRIDRSKLKWKAKLAGAFDGKVDQTALSAKDQREAKRSKWILFTLPLITVLREGLEAVVFVGGVSLGQSARSIPLAAITGILCGLVIGYLIYASGNRVSLSVFLVISTNVLFLLGAGLLSKSVAFFQIYAYNHGVGGDVAETGSGPGSFDPTNGLAWHVPYGNPDIYTATDGYSIFNAILGWENTATIGTILAYIFFWLACIGGLVYMKWSEGRCRFFGLASPAWHRRQARRARSSAGAASSASAGGEEEKKVETPTEEREDRQFASHI